MVNSRENDIRRQLEQMDPYQLEKLVAKIWEERGYQTNVRTASGDRGIDVEAIKTKPFDERVLIQVKRYTGGNKVGSDEVRKYSTLKNQESNADVIVLVTTSDFTTPAETLATDLNVKTINGNELSRLTHKYFDEIGNSFPELNTESNEEAPSDVHSEREERPSHPFDTTPSMTEPTKNHGHYQTCSVCKKTNSIWYTKGDSAGELLKCDSCGTLWCKKGWLFKTWQIIKEGNR